MANCQTEDERQRTAELIRPILRGRDIKRYEYDWADLWLIYIPWHFPYQFDESIQGASDKAEIAFKEQYPAVYSHMLQYKEPLSKRNKAETGIRYEWYAMQRWGAKYWEDFNKPKIVWNRIAAIKQFAYVKDEMYIQDSMHFIIGDKLIYLCSVLNSKIIQWLLSTIIGETAGGNAGNADNIWNLPIPLNDSDENVTDDFLYRKYCLSNEEIDIIESQQNQ
ncbi:MAG: type II restriction endonuclease [Prevotellaceae bacterium]|nr:type II restriction endonuclease [Candidatus Faecinaster equi]